MMTTKEKVEQGIRIRADIEAEYKKGYSPREIRERLGITSSQYNYHSKLLRSEGRIGAMHSHTQSVRPARQIFYVKMGTLSGVFENVDKAVLEWVRDESKHYETVSEYLREVLLEQYYHEHE